MVVHGRVVRDTIGIKVFGPEKNLQTKRRKKKRNDQLLGTLFGA